jgi:hypothetical protein
VTAVHTKESIQALLQNRDEAVYKGLIAIFERQTEGERRGGTTQEHNGVGFSRFDAPFLTDMVRSYRIYGRLTPKQLAVTRNKIKRYWRQLVEIANERAEPAKAAAIPATMQSALPDGVGDYLGSRATRRMCGCEENDGEVPFEDCGVCVELAIRRSEADQGRRVARGSW